MTILSVPVCTLVEGSQLDDASEEINMQVKSLCEIRTKYVQITDQEQRESRSAPGRYTCRGAVGCGRRAEEAKPAGPAKELFVKNCALCHSADGTAQTSFAKKLGVKNLSESKLTDAQIIQQVSEGRQENQSPSKMPAFKERLTRPEIESLVPVVKDFRKENSQANLKP